MEDRATETFLVDEDQAAFISQASRYALVGFIFGMVFPILATAVKLQQLQLPANISNIFTLHKTDGLLWIIDSAPLFLGFFAGIAGRRQDNLIKTNKLLLEREKELTAIKEDLEKRVEERTNDLQLRNSQLRSSVYFTRQIAEIKDLSSLPTKIVDIIKQNFEHYDNSLFFLDDSGKTAVLQASSSEVGRKMLVQGYRINVSDLTIIGRAVDKAKLYQSSMPSGQAWTDTLVYGNSKGGFEIAIPLIARGRVIGVLDIQSDQNRAFDQNEEEILQLLADQVAASVDNSRLLTRSQSFMDQVENLTTKQTHSTWREYLKNKNLAFQYTAAGVRSIAPRSAAKDDEALHIPLLLRGQEIGSIQLQRDGSKSWSDSENDLAKKVALQAALALDNSRLLEETRQNALQEQTVNQISARLNRTLDVDTLLQTIVRELAGLPEVSEASIFVKPSGENK